MKTLSWHQKVLLKKEIKLKCLSFQQLGYSAVNEADVMNYLVAYRWKKKQPKTIKDCRKDISAIKPNEFFDYQQLVAQTSSLQLKDWHDLEDLF
ncbi:hypothetical protein GIX45_02445 [Erwinia sp. CPCC 100877]|nr:hypothetical protein [Erwinia sp. CPCC 100877]